MEYATIEPTRSLRSRIVTTGLNGFLSNQEKVSNPVDIRHDLIGYQMVRPVSSQALTANSFQDSFQTGFAFSFI